jgi:hypothetical protein
VRNEFMESSHCDIRRAMVAWLRVNGGRFWVPVQMDPEQPGSMHCGFPIDWNDPESYTDVEPMTELRLAGLHPAIRVTLARSMMVHVKLRLGWQPLFMASAQPVATGTGVWVEAWPVGDASVAYGTPEEVWHAGVFERFLTWVNDVLAPATHLAFWQDADEILINWEFVLEGVVMTSGMSIDSCAAPNVLLPLHGWGGAALLDGDTALG